MRRDKFLTALLMTSCVLSVTLACSNQAYAAYTKEQEAEIALWNDYVKDYANDAFGYVSRANINLAAQEYDKAIADYDTALKIDKYNTDAYVRRGNAKYHLKNYDGAIKDYSVALEINPALADARFNVGRVYYDLQDFPKAIENMNMAVGLNPTNPLYQFELARAEYKSGLYQQAMTNFEKATDLDAKFYDAYYGAGLVALNIGQYEVAVDKFGKVLESGKTYSNVNYYKGVAEYQLGKYSDAINDLEIAIKNSPKDSLAYNYRGKCYEILGKKSEAKQDYKVAKSLGLADVGLTDAEKKSLKSLAQKDVKSDAPKVVEEKSTVVATSSPAPQQVREVQERTVYTPARELTEEEIIAQRVMTRSPNYLKPEEKTILDDATNRRLAEEMIALGDTYSAVAMYDNLVENDPVNSANYVERANLKLGLSDNDGAIRDAELAKRVSRNATDANYIEAQAFENKGLDALAYQSYVRTLRDEPKNPEYQIAFAKAALKVGRFDEADEVMSVLLDSNEVDYPEAYLIRANARYGIKEYYSAVADYTKYLKFEPKSSDAYFRRGVAKAALTRYEDAVKDYNMAVKYDRKNIQYRQARANANMRIKKFNKVSSDYKKILSLKGKNSDVEDIRRIALTEAMAGHKREAIVYYDLLLQKDEYNVNAFMERAKLRQEVGLLYDSINDYSAVLRIDVNRAEAYRERGLLYVTTRAFRRAVDDLNVAVKYYPHDAKVLYNRAVAKQAMGDKEGAIRDFDAVKRMEDL